MASNGATVGHEWLHENNGYQLLITAIVFLILNTTSVVMRFATRNLRTTASPPFGWDDLCILLGWLFAEGIAIDSICKSRNTASKESLHTNKKVAAHFGQGPLQLWEASNIITDVIMLALPLPVLAKLQVRRSTKIGTFVAFGIASVGLIPAVARFAEFVLHPIAADPTYNGTTLYIWLTVEPGIYLMAACLISCRPLLTNVLASHFTVSVFTWTRKTLRRSTTTGTAEGTGVSNSAAEGDYYKLVTLARPDQIHVRREFTVTASDNAV
ncbi:hypothetical protein LSUE1_G004790 [Lachnellula suecica]|uniref:Rhodopsin domain-containing protein n=1 Tax=Lachnellula suecica TaxID=602035 RepID=A0A8T9C852_9HELO|nr:hypothetical protein LSUE1_G004790 [Lachnellula suecica]